MTKVEKNLKRRISNLLKKFNVTDFSIRNISDESRDLLEDFVDIFNKFTGEQCYALYYTERYGVNVSVLAFTSQELTDEFLDKFTLIMRENENEIEEDGGDIICFLADQFGGK